MKYTNCLLFQKISEEEFKRMTVCFNAREIKYLAGDEICSYDSKNKRLGIISQGKAYVKKLDINGNYTILETLVKGGVFSEALAYQSTDIDCISVIAAEPCAVIFIDYHHLVKRCPNACTYHSQLVENFMQILINKTNILSERIEILSSKTIRDKILGYCSLTVKKIGSYSFTMPMPYSSFAEYICVDRSAMMRELKKLNDEGILSVNKKHITLIKR